ncbi:hypothetical protein DFQ05_2484 [Winogradskyella wandonensis]|uniref:Uncharacterized protein n=1 Tax=Winogradskyella wandonensis TaxID=1442586 RepID=A0A4R1KLS3_9FLAO|nr:hypothetical protein [Winogradskyella wandonensis]TCK65267.1 hypothetical protein DFQ05_2484 [Winogradskyella wandonensis]
MRKHFVYILLIVNLFSCSKRYTKKSDALDFIPQQHHTIIKINNLESFKELQNLNLPFKELKIDSLINHTGFINIEQPLYLSFANQSAALISKYHKDLIRKDSLLKTESTQDKTIFKSIFKNDTIYHRVVDSIFFASKDVRLVKTINDNENLEVKALFSTSSENSTASILFKNSINNELLFEKNRNADSISKYDILDITSEIDAIAFNGVTVSQDSSYFFSAFKNTKPQTFNLAKIIPENAESFKRVAFDDFDTFYKNLKTRNLAKKDSTKTGLLSLSNEIAFIETSIGTAIAINFLDIDILKSGLIDISIQETHKKAEIFKLSKPVLFEEDFSPFFEFHKTNYGFVLENFLVLSDNLEILKHIIDSKVNNKTLSESEKWLSVTEKIASNSSLLIYKNEKGLEKYLNRNSAGFNCNVIQYIAENDFAHINGVYAKSKKRAQKNSVTESFSIELPAELIAPAQTVKNHVTGGSDILVQDVNNFLYQISKSGRVQWKKQLDGPVLGKIEQIDIYNNGKLQLAFATANQLHVIDRNGRVVSPFPLKFSEPITQPLSVFDYDKQKNYRLLITQDKNLLMYDVKGKHVNGFKYKSASKSISSQPKHFRIGTKDYIVFSQGKKLEILNRQGQKRVKVKGDLDFSNNSIYNYRNRFVTTTKAGLIAEVNTNGTIKFNKHGLNSDSNFTATSKTLVSLTDNLLKVNNKTVELDFGNYTAPKIFYLNNKIYITTTDLQSSKVYVFDSQARLLPNFPVYGTSASSLVKLHRNKDVFVITQSDTDVVSIYKIN